MTVQSLISELHPEVFHLAQPDQAVTGGYCGDLLSWVMGSAPAHCAWLTIMSNVNVAAVAALTDVSCVILAEGVRPDAPLLAAAEARGINLLGVGMTSWDCAVRLDSLLKK